MGTRAGEPAGYTPAVAALDTAIPADAGAAETAAVFESIAVAVAVLDADGRVRSANPRARQLLGLDREGAGGPLLPRRWPGSVYDEDGRLMDPAGWPLACLPAGGREAASRLFRVCHPSRPAPTWVQLTAAPLGEAGAAPQGVVVTLADATALAETRAELEDVVADRATLLEAVPDLFIYVGTDDRVTRVVGERRGVAVDGRRSQVPTVGSRTWELFQGEAAGKARQAVALARATGRPVTTELHHETRSGTRFEDARHVPLAGGKLLVTLRDITERKRTEDALIRSEEKYRTLYTRTPVMLHSIDAEGRLVGVSDRWLERLGYTASEVLGRRSTEFLTEASRRLAAEQVLPEFFRTGSCTDVPYQMVGKSGEIVDVLLSATAERDQTGHVARSLAVLVDVSAQRAAEEEVARQEGTLHAVVDQAPMLLWTLGPDLTVTSLRGGASGAAGVTAADVVGRPPGKLADDATALVEAARLALAGTPADYEHVLGGRVFGGRLQPLTGAEGDVMGAVGVSYDLTERRAAQAELHARREQLRIAVDHAPTLLWTVDTELRITSSRGGGLEALGFQADTAVGLAVQQSFAAQASGDAAVSAHRRALDGQASSYELTLAGRTFATLLEPLRDEGGAIVGAVGVAHDVTEARRAQDALSERERTLSTLFHNLPGMAYRCDTDERRSPQFVSEGCRELLERSPDELVGGIVSWSDLIHPDDRRRVRENVDAALKRDERWTLVYRIVVPGMRIKWVWERGVGVRDDEGRLLHLEGFVSDISERRRAEDALRDREQMLSGLVGSLPGAAYRTPMEAPLETPFISDGCVELTGYTAAELVGGRPGWADIVHPDDKATVFADLERDLASRGNETLSEYRITRKDGSVRWILDRAVFVRDETGTSREIIGLLTDITSRRETEQALRERDAQVQGLMANIPGMAYRCQAEAPWKDEFIGASCLEMTGYAPEQLIAGDPVWEDIMDPADRDRLLRETQAAIAAERAGELEYRIRTASGEERWIWDRFHIVRDDHGAVIALEGLMLDVTDRHSAEEESQRLRLHDTTTGLPNRFLFTDRISQALAHAARRRLGFAVVALAVDRFSTLVDTLGHEACERLLVAVADRLTESIRTEDTVACLAGSEFGILLAGVGGPAHASGTVEAVTRAFSYPFQVDAHELFLTLSIGIALYPADGDEASQVLEHAEVAARRVSSEGGNTWQFFRRGMNDEHAGRLALEGELHRALERDQFLLYYQPVVDAASGRIMAAEALLRWRRADGTLALPAEFLDVLEETGLSVPVGAWVLRHACAQAKSWSGAFPQPVRVAVNLSTRQLYDEALLDRLGETFRESGLQPERLAIEITETTAMRDPEEAARIVTALRGLGVHVALDDFGTGYSSLSHLIRLPVVTVKIDRSFVRDLLTVPEHAAVAASVIALGHRLGLTVIAEGVETREERDFLRAEGCDGLQGFLFSRPVPPEELARLLAAEHPGDPAG
jgi:diguanylate cyclase (GGDEF)-like protein/PAS domain S-box-containing protein